jgi:FKBP-type peptidyl-prolyl cis-trans isomerase 2
MKHGDFVKMDFVGRVIATNEVFDVTSEEVAKKEGVHNPKHKYGPILVIIGAGMVVPGVEKHLMEMKVGEEREFTVKPGEGFGMRSPQMIRIISMANFIKDKINPVPGAFVDIDGRQARIQSVSGGRVRVDFNHPLAGKELSYKVRIMEEITKALDKAKALLENYGIEAEPQLTESKLTIKSGKPLNQFVERILSETIKKWVKEIKETRFVSEEKSETKKVPEKSG